MPKRYKVWLKVTVEEIDEDRDIYRNVTMVNGELVEDIDPDTEISLFESGDYDEARTIADACLAAGEGPII